MHNKRASFRFWVCEGQCALLDTRAVVWSVFRGHYGKDGLSSLISHLHHQSRTVPPWPTSLPHLPLCPHPTDPWRYLRSFAMNHSPTWSPAEAAMRWFSRTVAHLLGFSSRCHQHLPVPAGRILHPHSWWCQEPSALQQHVQQSRKESWSSNLRLWHLSLWVSKGSWSLCPYHYQQHWAQKHPSSQTRFPLA